MVRQVSLDPDVVKNLYSSEEARNIYRIYERFNGPAIGKVFPFEKPHGPSRFIAYDKSILLFESLVTEKRFRVTPDQVLGKQPLTEMEIIAWAAK